MMPGTPRRAIGLVNATVAHKDRARDLQAIQTIARLRGYQLTHILDIGANTYMPRVLIATTAVEHGAEAMVAPSCHHFGGQPDALAHAVTLETWAGTTPRVTWDATR